MEKKHYSKKSSAKHKVWRYIRRNRLFSFVDCMIVCNVSEQYLKTILWHLEKAKYIKQKNESTSLKKRTYVHCLDATFGVKSPSIVNGIIHDLNTGKTYDVKPEKKEQIEKETFIPTVLTKLLEAMTEPLMSKEQITLVADVDTVAAKKHWKRLELSGVIKAALNTKRRTTSCTKYIRTKGKKAFHIDIEKAKLALENIKNGGYNKKTNSKLQQFWEPLDLLKNELTTKSQQTVADELGVSKATINQLKNEKYPNTEKMYKKIKDKYSGKILEECENV